MFIAQIAIAVPVVTAFSYSVPPELIGRVARGMRCRCPFQRRTVVGMVLRVTDEPAPSSIKLRPILSLIDDAPLIGNELITFLELLADYYFAPIGEVMRLAIPPEERNYLKKLNKSSDRGHPSRGRELLVAKPIHSEMHNINLRPNASAMLAYLQANGPTTLTRLSEVFSTARALIKRLQAQGLVQVEKQRQPPDEKLGHEVEPDQPPELNRDQLIAVEQITEAVQAHRPQSFLLHGVTGSGKTEVYMRAISQCLNQQQGVIALVPEIALTPQLVSRFRARFGDAVAVVHSAMSPRARWLTWHALRENKLHIAIGVRSAVFAPVHSLGLVIVDEEHDPSFKQEQGVRYHARDMALLRAQRAGAVCVLGSATPSLETEALVRRGKLTRLGMFARATSAPMPSVQLVDMRYTGVFVSASRLGPMQAADGDRDTADHDTTYPSVAASGELPASISGLQRTSAVLSIPLHRALQTTLQNHEQAIVFLNRRGFAPSVQCEVCGEIVQCPTCSVATTLHRFGRCRLRCHYCDYEASVPSRCEHCGAVRFTQIGWGTESLENLLQQAFPAARIARLDRDIAPGMQSEAVIDKMRTQQADILVGTQMVTKGHDLPNVTLVAVVNADAELSMPDFRASERAFQRLIQVAGRAGRADKAGHVIVQTRVPQHPVLQHVLQHDVTGFVDQELQSRLDANYPPYSRLVLIRLACPDLDRLRAEAERIAAIARTFASRMQVQVLGPSPAPIERIRGKFLYRILLRSKQRTHVRTVARHVVHSCDQADRLVRVTIDMDPIQMM